MSVSFRQVDLTRFADGTCSFGPVAVVVYRNASGKSKRHDGFGHGTRLVATTDAQPMPFCQDAGALASRFCRALLHCRVWRRRRRWQFSLRSRRILDRRSQAHLQQPSDRWCSAWPRRRDTHLASNGCRDHSERSGIQSPLGRTIRTDQPTLVQLQGCQWRGSIPQGRHAKCDRRHCMDTPCGPEPGSHPLDHNSSDKRFG